MRIPLVTIILAVTGVSNGGETARTSRPAVRSRRALGGWWRPRRVESPRAPILHWAVMDVRVARLPVPHAAPPPRRSTRALVGSQLAHLPGGQPRAHAEAAGEGASGGRGAPDSTLYEVRREAVSWTNSIPFADMPMRVFMSSRMGGSLHARSRERLSSTFCSSAFSFASFSSFITEGSSCISRILPCTRLLKGFLRTGARNKMCRRRYIQ